MNLTAELPLVDLSSHARHLADLIFGESLQNLVPIPFCLAAQRHWLI